MKKYDGSLEAKLRRHASLFPRAASALEDIFNRLVLGSPEADMLECSCKVDGGGIHGARMNLWFSGHLLRQEALVKAQGFLRQCAQIAPLDLSLYRQIVGADFQYDKARCTVVGIDAREEPNKSRIKLWHIAEHYPEIEDKVLGLPGIAPAAQCFKILPELLFGFDFGMEGGTALKVYPMLHARHIQPLHNVLNSLLGERTLRLVEQCRWVNFGFTSKKPGISLHLLPWDPEVFISNFHHPVLSDVYRLSGAPQKVIVSLDQAEVESGCYSTFNYYY
jgi:LynF/TruF/PatF family peptide O-prenyltransferase